MVLFLLSVLDVGMSSQGVHVAIRPQGGPAGLCGCQSLQEECLETETTGSKITVHAFSHQGLFHLSAYAALVGTECIFSWLKNA